MPKPTKLLSSIPVLFQPEMAADAGSFSPSAGKPPFVVADWRAHGLPIEVRRFDPVDEAAFRQSVSVRQGSCQG